MAISMTYLQVGVVVVPSFFLSNIGNTEMLNVESIRFTSILYHSQSIEKVDVDRISIGNFDGRGDIRWWN